MRIAILISSLLWSIIVCAQRKPVADGWQPRIDSLLEDSRLQYAAILAVMKPIRSSDSLMRYLQASAKTSGHLSAEAFAVNSLGVLERNASRYEAALALNREAEALARASDDSLSIIVALNSQGVVLRRADRIIEALDVHQTALELAGEIKNPDFGTLRAIAISHNSKGQIHRTLKQYELAKEAFQQSMSVEERNGNTFGLAINYANLGSIYTKQDSLDKALASYRQAIAYNEQLNSSFGIAICQLGLSEIALKQGDAQRALLLAEGTLPAVDARGDAKYIAVAKQAAGDALLALGRLDEAEEVLIAAHALATEKNLPEQQIKALYSLVSVDAARGDLGLAYRRLRKTYDVEQQVISAQTQRYVAAVDASYQAKQREAMIEQLARDNEQARVSAQRERRQLIAIIAALTLLAGVLLLLFQQRKLRFQRDIAQLEQQRMASQMNPHFIFNGLNSIKSSLIDGDARRAVELLGKYSNFMRRILGSSIDQEVSLTEELSSCELYVAIENARFNGEIDYNVQVDPSINLDEVQVPPLVLQPFLENSIHHGLRSKKGPKEVSVTVEQGDGEQLCIRIADNGVGRAVANERKVKSILGRKSVGIDITRRRLQYYTKRQGREVDLAIRDLVTSTGDAAGTEVVLRVG